MQFLALITSVVLNLGLLGLALWRIFSGAPDAMDVWTYCIWSSAVLIVLHLAFCIYRMVMLWRKGRKEASLWGIAVLALIPIGAYFLLGGYLIPLAAVGGG